MRDFNVFTNTIPIPNPSFDKDFVTATIVRRNWYDRRWCWNNIEDTDNWNFSCWMIPWWLLDWLLLSYCTSSIYRIIDALMRWCIDALMHWCVDALMHWCIEAALIQKIASNYLHRFRGDGGYFDVEFGSIAVKWAIPRARVCHLRQRRCIAVASMRGGSISDS